MSVQKELMYAIKSASTMTAPTLVTVRAGTHWLMDTPAMVNI